MSETQQATDVYQKISDKADAIEADYGRWNEFDKSPRLACHSERGVIELMPVADARRFATEFHAAPRREPVPRPARREVREVRDPLQRAVALGARARRAVIVRVASVGAERVLRGAARGLVRVVHEDRKSVV